MSKKTHKYKNILQNIEKQAVIIRNVKLRNVKTKFKK